MKAENLDRFPNFSANECAQSTTAESALPNEEAVTQCTHLSLPVLKVPGSRKSVMDVRRVVGLGMDELLVCWIRSQLCLL